MKILLLTEEPTNFIDEQIILNSKQVHDINRGNIMNCDYILLPHRWEYHYRKKDFQNLKNINYLSSVLNKKIIGLTYGAIKY